MVEDGNDFLDRLRAASLLKSKEIEPTDEFEALMHSRLDSVYFDYLDHIAEANNLDNSDEVKSMHHTKAAKLVPQWDEAKDRLDRHRKEKRCVVNTEKKWGK